jgi:peptide/nickel transport system ATP-binding protein
VHAVDRLSFTVAPGEVLGIVGESGCGKTAIALSLLRLLPETAVISGRAVFDNADLLSLSARGLRQIRGREISFVFQEPTTSLNPVMTVDRQVGEVLRKHLGLSRARARERTLELLRLVRIPAPEQQLHHYPHQLSGGMRQRVMIAMALACDPRLLIADEPTTALDVTTQAGILALIHEIREHLGTAVILITHDLAVVADIADRVLVLYAGRKAEEAPADVLFEEPQHPYTNALLRAIPRRQDGTNGRLREIPGRVPPLRELPSGCAFIERCPRSDGLRCTDVPEVREVRRGHLVACFHPGGE